jgi:hypothetical protein
MAAGVSCSRAAVGGKGAAMAGPEDVERLRAERNALEERVEKLEARPERRRRVARISATILTILAVLLFAVAVPGLWARRTVLDTDRYVATVAPLANDPAVQEFLARTISVQLFEALDVQTRLTQVLQQRDPRLAFLAGPIATGAEGFVEDQLQKIFATPEFATVWEQANRFAHSQLIAALRGEGETVAVQNGKVVLNLVPLVNQSIAAISSVVTDLIGHPITLPPISADEVPSEAITKLESALGIDLPDDLGSIVVYDSEDLQSVQQTVDLASRGIVLLAVLFLVLAAIALWVSPRTRRTLLQLATAAAVVLVIERRFAIAEGNAIVDKVIPENQAVARAVVDQVLGSLLRYTGWFLLVAILVLVIALVSGPYPWAVRVRLFTADLARAAAGAVRDREPAGAVAWVAAHRDALMLGGAALGALILLFVDLSLLGFLVLAILLAVYELVVYRAGSAKLSPAD